MDTVVGLIGGGAMGKLYAEHLSRAGYSINISDVPDKVSGLRSHFTMNGLVNVLDDSHEVSANSDMIIYSVPAFQIGKIVREYAPSTKFEAIIAGQTSVKAPEIAAFDAYLPGNPVVTAHSMHGPMDPTGRNLAVMRHRATDEEFKRAMDVYLSLGSKVIPIGWEAHDIATADTQVATHLAFLSMATAWKDMGGNPWDNVSYTGGIDNAKILMSLRILNGESHVYSGLAMLNPHAKKRAQQYAESVTGLYALMATGRHGEFADRVMGASDYVFGTNGRDIALPDDALEEYALGSGMGVRKPNSHLSLLAMVDAWHKSEINPYDNELRTPPFNVRVGIAEYLFRHEGLLMESLKAATENIQMRGDDLAFVCAVRDWNSLIQYGGEANVIAYHDKFADVEKYFRSVAGRDMVAEGFARSKDMIGKLGV